MDYVSKSQSETAEVAADFAKKVEDGSLVYLIGELGAGKTTFVKALAGKLGVKERVLSPTYTIVRYHPLKQDQTLYHIDLYRVKDNVDLSSIGLEEALENPKNIILVEWADNLDPKKADYLVYFYKDGNERRIRITNPV